jgi:hypothetical protein
MMLAKAPMRQQLRVAATLDPTDEEKIRLVLEELALAIWAESGEPRATGSLPVPATCEMNILADVRSIGARSDGIPSRLSQGIRPILCYVMRTFRGDDTSVFPIDPFDACFRDIAVDGGAHSREEAVVPYLS